LLHHLVLLAELIILGYFIVMHDLSRGVPLPDVASVTDTIIIRDLGLPHGFDDERLLINVRALEGFRKAAAIGEITIASSYSNEEYNLNVDGAHGDGTTTARASGVGRQSETSSTVVIDRFGGDIQADRSGSHSEKMGEIVSAGLMNNLSPVSVAVRPDLRTRDDYLRKRYGSEIRNAQGHANFLNKSIKSGLHEANRKVNFSPGGLEGAVRAHLLMGTVALYAGAIVSFLPVISFDSSLIEGSVLSTFALRPLFMVGLSKYIGQKDDMNQDEKDFFQHVLKHDARTSFIMGASIDRYALGLGRLSGRRLVKARA
jgi:hypothetical protein